MGLILDTSVLIDGERQGTSVSSLLERLKIDFPLEPLAVSGLSVLELAQGVERARDPEQKMLRLMFIQEVRESLRTIPASTEVCFAAGRLNGELRSRGVSVGIVDLLIGSTALALGYAVLIRNLRDFGRIPTLKVIEVPSALS